MLGFHQNDGYDYWLHDQVWGGVITLAVARAQTASDWIS
jgi:hypothetical protein